jgi:hypothetical protein
MEVLLGLRIVRSSLPLRPTTATHPAPVPHQSAVTHTAPPLSARHAASRRPASTLTQPQAHLLHGLPLASVQRQRIGSALAQSVQTTPSCSSIFAIGIGTKGYPPLSIEESAPYNRSVLAPSCQPPDAIIAASVSANGKANPSPRMWIPSPHRLHLTSQIVLGASAQIVQGASAASAVHPHSPQPLWTKKPRQPTTPL